MQIVKESLSCPTCPPSPLPRLNSHRAWQSASPRSQPTHTSKFYSNSAGLDPTNGPNARSAPVDQLGSYLNACRCTVPAATFAEKAENKISHHPFRLVNVSDARCQEPGIMASRYFCDIFGSARAVRKIHRLGRASVHLCSGKWCDPSYLHGNSGEVKILRRIRIWSVLNF